MSMKPRAGSTDLADAPTSELPSNAPDAEERGAPQLHAGGASEAGRSRAAVPSAGATGRGSPAVAVSEDGSAVLDEPPPFLGSWRNIYILLVAELALTAILFAALTRWAS